MGAEAELLCHFTGICLDGCKVYHKSILLGGLLATKSIPEQESTHAIRGARMKEGKKTPVLKENNGAAAKFCQIHGTRLHSLLYSASSF